MLALLFFKPFFLFEVAQLKEEEWEWEQQTHTMTDQTMHKVDYMTLHKQCWGAEKKVDSEWKFRCWVGGREEKGGWEAIRENGRSIDKYHD